MEHPKQLREQVEPIIRKAGGILLSYFNKPIDCAFKEGGSFVTEADIKSEEFLKKELAKVFPEAAFFAEESGKSGSGDYCWVIDPLDGTTNFCHYQPYFCISVALTYKDEPVFAVIYAPVLKEFFYAEKGKGAFLNGKPIKVSQPENFNMALVGVGLPYAVSDCFLALFEKMKEVEQTAYSFRHLGAAALDAAFTACGRFDGFFLGELGWWDVAAGMLLIQEAGGQVTDFQGAPVGPNYKTLVGGGKLVHGRLSEILKEAC